MASDGEWERRPIIALPFTAEGLDTSQGGSPTLMELLAITGGLQILQYLNLSGKVLSDCQGLIRKIAQRHVLRRNPTNAGYPQLNVHPTLTHEAIAQASIQPADWYFIAPGQAPLLDGLRPALAHAFLLDYVQTRDAS